MFSNLTYIEILKDSGFKDGTFCGRLPEHYLDLLKHSLPEFNFENNLGITSTESEASLEHRVEQAVNFCRNVTELFDYQPYDTKLHMILTACFIHSTYNKSDIEVEDLAHQALIIFKSSDYQGIPSTLFACYAADKLKMGVSEYRDYSYKILNHSCNRNNIVIDRDINALMRAYDKITPSGIKEYLGDDYLRALKFLCATSFGLCEQYYFRCTDYDKVLILLSANKTWPMYKSSASSFKGYLVRKIICNYMRPAEAWLYENSVLNKEDIRDFHVIAESLTGNACNDKCTSKKQGLLFVPHTHLDYARLAVYMNSLDDWKHSVFSSNSEERVYINTMYISYCEQLADVSFWFDATTQDRISMIILMDRLRRTDPTVFYMKKDWFERQGFLSALKSRRSYLDEWMRLVDRVNSSRYTTSVAWIPPEIIMEFEYYKDSVNEDYTEGASWYLRRMLGEFVTRYKSKNNIAG